jgi:hypothetical protein
MGLLNKIPFLKHKEVPIPEKDEFGTSFETAPVDPLKDQTGLDNVGNQADRLGLPPENSNSLPQQNINSPGPQFEPVQESPTSQPSSFDELHKKPMQAPHDNLSKNIEVISSKMDTIKAVLDNLSQKIEKIEKIAEGEKEEEPKRNYGW